MELEKVVSKLGRFFFKAMHNAKKGRATGKQKQSPKKESRGNKAKKSKARQIKAGLVKESRSMSRIHGWLWNIVAPQISHHGAEVPRGGPRVLSSGHEYFSAAGQAQGKQEEGRGGTILIVPLQDMLWWWWWWCVWGCSWLCSPWGWPGSGQPTRRVSRRSRRWKW